MKKQIKEENYLKEIYNRINEFEDDSPKKYLEKFIKKEGSWYVICCIVRIINELDLGRKQTPEEVEKIIDERISLWETDENTGYIICGAVLTELEELKSKIKEMKDG